MVLRKKPCDAFKSAHLLQWITSEILDLGGSFSSQMILISMDLPKFSPQ